MHLNFEQITREFARRLINHDEKVRRGFESAARHTVDKYLSWALDEERVSIEDLINEGPSDLAVIDDYLALKDIKPGSLRVYQNRLKNFAPWSLAYLEVMPRLSSRLQTNFEFIELANQALQAITRETESANRQTGKNLDTSPGSPPESLSTDGALPRTVIRTVDHFLTSTVERSVVRLLKTEHSAIGYRMYELEVDRQWLMERRNGNRASREWAIKEAVQYWTRISEGFDQWFQTASNQPVEKNIELLQQIEGIKIAYSSNNDDLIALIRTVQADLVLDIQSAPLKGVV